MPPISDDLLPGAKFAAGGVRHVPDGFDPGHTGKGNAFGQAQAGLKFRAVEPEGPDPDEHLAGRGYGDWPVPYDQSLGRSRAVQYNGAHGAAAHCPATGESSAGRCALRTRARRSSSVPASCVQDRGEPAVEFGLDYGAAPSDHRLPFFRKVKEGGAPVARVHLPRAVPRRLNTVNQLAGAAHSDGERRRDVEHPARAKGGDDDHRLEPAEGNPAFLAQAGVHAGRRRERHDLATDPEQIIWSLSLARW